MYATRPKASLKPVYKFKKWLKARFAVARYDYSHAELDCDVGRCVSLYGFGFSANDWHYLASTMRQYLAEPNIHYRDTHLWAYFQKFQPRDMCESLFGKNCDDKELSEALMRYRDPERGPMPWTPTPAFERAAPAAVFAGDYGPMEDELIAERFRRVVSVVDALKSHGYRRDMLSDPDDTIRGVLVKHGNDWKMVLIGGNHRASALAALGHKTIPVQSHRGLPGMIDIANAAAWPCVARGALPEAVARRIALSYFQYAGNKRAEALGLL